MSLFAAWLLLSPVFSAPTEISLLSFNVLSGGAPAAEVGTSSPLYRQPRHETIADVILKTGADIVCVNEPPGANDPILACLQREDTAWTRRGGSNGRISVQLYARFPIEPDPRGPSNLNLHRVRVTPTHSIFVHTIHWWPAKGYGPDYIQRRILAGDLPSDPARLEAQVIDAIGLPSTYRATLNAVRPHLDAGEPVFILGDFNEPSHLDWTADYAVNGRDRWVKNPTHIALRPKINWPGSKMLAEAGFRDAYRVVFPDPVTHPGDTWTTPYANGTPGRRPYDGNTSTTGAPNQVLARIDGILFSGEGVTVVRAGVVGENPGRTEYAGRAVAAPEFPYEGPWPSDHRAVLAVFRLADDTGTVHAAPQGSAAPGTATGQDLSAGYTP